MSKYCIMPFISVRIEDDLNLHSNKIRPCCFYNFENSVKFQSLNDYLNSPELAELQRHLLHEDSLPLGCQMCQQVEDAKQLSVRQLKGRYFENIKLEQICIQELDIMISNVCNLSCIMCNPKFSSAVGAEYVKLGWVDRALNFDITDFALEGLKNLPNLKYVSIAGGEFFYVKRHKEILQSMIDQGITNIKITSNGSIYNQDTLDILKQIPNLSLRFSIDGTNDIYEFIRYPAKWHEVQANVLKYKEELPNVHIELVIVMNPITIFGIYDWLKFANDNNLETHYINILGEILAWEMLTDQERLLVSNFLIQNIKKHKLDQKQLLTVMNYAKSTIPGAKYNPIIRKKTIDNIVALCQIRKINKEHLLALFKHLSNLNKEINERMSDNNQG